MSGPGPAAAAAAAALPKQLEGNATFAFTFLQGLSVNTNA